MISLPIIGICQEVLQQMGIETMSAVKERRERHERWNRFSKVSPLVKSKVEYQDPKHVVSGNLKRMPETKDTAKIFKSRKLLLQASEDERREYHAAVKLRETLLDREDAEN